MEKNETVQPGKAAKRHRAPQPEITYQVTSEGYKETFETKHAAMAQADVLKKRGVKAKEEFTISVKEVKDGKTGKEVHRVDIKEDFYK